MQIDLNADLGEGSPYDAELMGVISSCNIACGGHAGDAFTMAEALDAAKAHKVAAGAHISYPDRVNFGRKPMEILELALERALRAQLLELLQIADQKDIQITHLKPHGALYHRTAQDHQAAQFILALMTDLLPGARLVGPPGSAMQIEADSLGVRFSAEGFADRAYETDGGLRDRALPGAVLTNPSDQVDQATQLAKHGRVTAHDGSRLTLKVETVCVHGDTPNALEAARAIRSALETQGIKICAP